MNVWLLYPNQNFDPAAPLPPQAETLVQDLNLGALFAAMAQGDRFLFGIAQQVVLSGLETVDGIRYRQEILQDCLKYPDVIQQIYRLPLEAMERKQRHWLGIFSRYPGSILSGGVQTLSMYLDLLKDLKRLADEHGERFESRGFRRFFAMVKAELSEAYLDEVEQHLQRLQFREGVLLRAELGRGNEGTNYVLCKPSGGRWLERTLKRKSPVYSYFLHPRDDHGARALGELRERGINHVANAVGQAAEHVENFFNVLRQELAFYMAALNLRQALTALGMPVAIPQVASPGERCYTASGLYDACLALTMKKSAVGNDLAADGKSLVIITGANQGGKSTFLRSVGVAQVMMQCGLFVPAESFTADVCRGVFTHFKREEDATMVSGKLDEELGRMSAVADWLRPDSLMLFNESFAATNEREGSEIARQVVDALLERRVKVFFVTHQYELARAYHARALPDAIFLRADRKRDFKIRPGTPLPTSHGEDVYRQIFESDVTGTKRNNPEAASESVSHE